MKTTIVLLSLLFLCQAELTAQQDDKTKTKNLIAFVPEHVKQFQVFRSSSILRSNVATEFRQIAGKTFDRVSSRILNQYFKFGLADLEDIDAVIYANWYMTSERGGRSSRQFHSIMILRTDRPNEEKFDLATHATKSETEYKGKSILEMKRSLDGQYRFACILDDRTIIWARRKPSIEQAIAAGQAGPAKSAFYKAWQQVSKDQLNFFVRFDERDLRHAPKPLEAMKNLQWVVGGAEVGKTSKVKLIGKLESAKAAVKMVDNADKQLDFFRSMIQQQLTANPQHKVGLNMVLQLIDSTEVAHSSDRVTANAKVKIDPKKLVEPLTEFYAASSRTQAANNLRQNSLALLNFESAYGNFPPSVLTHESGKKYSWRIAILPFIERQDIYNQYDFTQDWDSPHNLEVTSEMPEFFRSDFDDPNSTNTSFFMLTGPGGAFSTDESTKISDFTDGTSNTMTIIQAKRDIHWAKPEDIVIDPDKPLPEFGGFHDGGFNVGMADGSVRFLSNDVIENVLREYLTPSGGEVPKPLIEPPSDPEHQDDDEQQRDK